MSKVYFVFSIFLFYFIYFLYLVEDHLSFQCSIVGELRSISSDIVLEVELYSWLKKIVMIDSLLSGKFLEIL